MNKPNFTPLCCGKEPVWVDNVPTKEYFYCRECKNEVMPVLDVLDVTREDPYGFIYYLSSLHGSNITDTMKAVQAEINRLHAKIRQNMAEQAYQGYSLNRQQK